MTEKDKMPAKKTISARAEDVGVSRYVITKAKAAGVDVWDDDAIAEYLGSRSRNIQAGAKLKDSTTENIEDLESLVLGANAYEEVRILKEKINALSIAQKMRAAGGQLLSRGEIEERDTRIAAAMKGALLKFANELPPQVEGMAAAKIQKRVKAEVVKMLEQLADETAEFWKEHPET